MTHRIPSRGVSRARMKNRAGFTLVEVVIASVILSGALLAMAGFSVRYQQVDKNARTIVRAQQAANERMETLRSAQPYAALDTMSNDELVIPGFPGYRRTTEITRVGGTSSDTVDYKIITVKVRTPGVARFVSKSSIVGAF
jgi:prepilin-type N-terminal cleavage/methylation domain-containing protein